MPRIHAEYLDGALAPSGTADNNSNAIVGHGLSFLVGRVSYTFGLQVRGGSQRWSAQLASGSFVGADGTC